LTSADITDIHSPGGGGYFSIYITLHEYNTNFWKIPTCRSHNPQDEDMMQLRKRKKKSEKYTVGKMLQ
jgi:hypothetical protein